MRFLIWLAALLAVGGAASAQNYPTIPYTQIQNTDAILLQGTRFTLPVYTNLPIIQQWLVAHGGSAGTINPCATAGYLTYYAAIGTAVSCTPTDPTVRSAIANAVNAASGLAGWPVSLSGSVTSTLGVSNGGTGATSLPSGRPLLGNGSSAIATGTISGSSTALISADGALTNTHLPEIDASGGLQDSGIAVSALGSGTVNNGSVGTLAGYTSTGTTVNPITVGSGLTLSGSTITANAVTTNNAFFYPIYKLRGGL